MFLIAQDPGKMTGIATYDTDLNVYDSFELTVEEYFDWIHSTIHDKVSQHNEVRLVTEAFIITVATAKNSQASWSLELIGVMKFLGYRYQLQPPVVQQSSVAKRFGTDQKLKLVGWYRPGKGHANDAGRHLMTYAATRKLIFDTKTLMEFAEL